MKKNKRDNNIKVRLNDEEYHKLQEIKDFKGLNDSEAIRKAIEIYCSICKYAPEKA